MSREKFETYDEVKNTIREIITKLNQDDTHPNYYAFIGDAAAAIPNAREHLNRDCYCFSCHVLVGASFETAERHIVDLLNHFSGHSGAVSYSKLADAKYMKSHLHIKGYPKRYGSTGSSSDYVYILADKYEEGQSYYHCQLDNTLFYRNAHFNPCIPYNTQKENAKIFKDSGFYIRVSKNDFVVPADSNFRDDWQPKSSLFQRIVNGKTIYLSKEENVTKDIDVCSICGRMLFGQDLENAEKHGKYIVCAEHDSGHNILEYGDDDDDEYDDDDDDNYVDDGPIIRGIISGYHSNHTPLRYFIMKDRYMCRNTHDNSGLTDVNVKHKAINAFAGLGFELEVDKCSNSSNEQSIYNNITAQMILDLGLDKDVKFERDGSLSNGFETISMSYIPEVFWQKQDLWQKMLKIFIERGYHSHDAGTCGLHVHVSRNMFGLTETVQDNNIGKVYTFYNNYWNDILRVSRRYDTEYCNKNHIRGQSYEDCDAKYEESRAQGKRDKECGSSHHVALNNGNRYTFEYRLGRGTLNAESFFAWIDLCLVITKNSTRVTIKNITDAACWLKGIKPSTAAYIYKRGAFKDVIKGLYPDVVNVIDTVTSDSESDRGSAR